MTQQGTEDLLHFKEMQLNFSNYLLITIELDDFNFLARNSQAGLMMQESICLTHHSVSFICMVMTFLTFITTLVTGHDCNSVS